MPDAPEIPDFDEDGQPIPHALPNYVPTPGQLALRLPEAHDPPPDDEPSFVAPFRKRKYVLSDYLKHKLIEYMRAYGRPYQAARYIGISKKCIEEHLDSDPEFAEEYDLARGEFMEGIDQEVRRRAIEGWEEPVFQMGLFVGYVRKYSDTLLMAYAKRHDPGYREKQSLDVTMAGGVMVIPAAAATVENWEAATEDAEYRVIDALPDVPGLTDKPE